MNTSETTVVYDLTQKTREGLMRWKKRDGMDQGFSNSKVVECYTTTHKEVSLELSVESRTDTEYDVDYYRTIIHLWMLGDDGDYLWRFPDNDALGDLLSTVRYQTGKVEDRLKRLLND